MTTRQPTLILLGGPTASGKTALAIALAKHFQTEIISADSRQVYREMKIGVARPSAEELAAVPHHLIGHVSIQEHYEVSRFESEALVLLDQLFLKYPVVIATGGTGLYLQVLMQGMDEMPAIPESIRAAVKSAFEQQGLPWLQAQVQACDPDYFKTVDQQNPVRLIRALEIYETTARPYSSFRTGQKKERPFRCVPLYLNPDRDLLYSRIESRLDLMLEQGLLEEIETLLPYQHLKALATVGYREFIPYFTGEQELMYCTLLAKTHSRQYAKRQFTWFNNQHGWSPIVAASTEEATEQALARIEVL
jgi:tRNA dimethylallyltransferase